jgi:hypothetical protein
LSNIAAGAEACDHGFSGFRHIGILPKAFTRVNIRDVHFDHRNLQHQQRVEDGDRGRGVAGRIDGKPGRFTCQRFLNPVDQFAFDIGLAEHHVDSEALGGLVAKLLDVGQRRGAVFLRLARSEQVQIGSV